MAETSDRAQLLQNMKNTPFQNKCCKATSAILSILLALTTLVIGSVYLNECTKQRMIPIYLIVMGCVTIVYIIFNVIMKSVSCVENNEDWLPGDVIKGIIIFFQFSWFIAGSVWIFSTFQPNYNDPKSGDYCHKVVYLYAFSITVIAYIFVGLMCIIGSCCALCAASLARNAADDQSES
ncbi:transmembrane protein 272-like [Protopterus annectens]|uniref:transmembrane protein 272-like n=1 Tax=Protopterus annectens TaxID=7888 RepID=UPI001CFA5799|nr:transmembrane protein 272-like [Protopterus annectens]XP_043928230.1 transmembrane protein 272-like [Protopterus annectens]XP_043928231.1 transmembrane protein 272-like [Protopterus annectens]